ncbi:unnamed protein product [Heterobilharzia americana]|nr:unnamed protein product [Heterobilharzia americana]
MVIPQPKMYFIKSLKREVTGSELSGKAGDGSLCFCTVVELNPKSASLLLEYCSVCMLNDNVVCKSPLLNTNSHIRILLGNAPDILECEHMQTLGQLSFRHIMEHTLHGSRSGDVYNVEFGYSSGRDEHTDRSDFSLFLRVDYILTPPVCGQYASLDTAKSESDPRRNSTADWNPDLAVHWLYRAWDLKERGSWLINHHLKCVTSGCEKSDNKDKLCRLIWASAFACYSRALQFASLCHWAEQTCKSESSQFRSDGDLPSNIKYGGERGSIHCIQVLSGQKSIAIFGSENLNTSDYLDWDHFSIVGFKTSYSLDCQPLRLEFIILSNIALCQLKVGSFEYCVQNCSQALYLLSRENKSVSYTDDQDVLTNAELFSPEKVHFYCDGFQITSQDICKVLFRRAQAYYNLGKMDEAKSDLEVCIQLGKKQLTSETRGKEGEMMTVSEWDNSDSYKRIKAALQASEKLMIKVCDSLSRERSQLLSRLRKKTHVN